jgi:hypothetical protein
VTVSKPVPSRRPARRGAAKKKRAARVQRPPRADEKPSPADETALVETLIETGQAAPPGPFRPGQTHEIVEDEQGRKTVVRKRTSLF